jgi:Zn-dependent peptidase ImmA (M78 family)/transcriptional regulator with XRE-family HTH domain
MTQTAPEINPVDVGRRLRIARKRAGITQAEAAAAIDVARTTLVAMEGGQREPRIGEVQRLARLYGISANELLRREAVHVELEPRFRKVSDMHDTDIAVKLMSNLARAEVELEQLLGIERVSNYPLERPILPGNVVAQAEHDAAELRQRLGLGLGPIPDIISLLELDLGVRVYVRRLDSRISGLFAYEEAIGACIMLNAAHPRERRAQTAAHECGHLVATRREPEINLVDEHEASRSERYANAFGRALLTPARGVRQVFQQVVAGSDRLTRRHIIILGHYFGVSREAMVRRLEELQLVKGGTWAWFEANGGITDEQAIQVLGDLRGPDKYASDAARPTALRLNLLAAEAYHRDLLSEGQLARLLQLDRVELRELLSGLENEGGETDDGPNVLT